MEVWKSIPGYGGHYEASSNGRIRVGDRVVRKYSNFANRVVEQRYSGRMLNPCPSSKLGHLTVHLGSDGIKYNVHVARLVLEAFVGPCPPGMEACHNNGCASDNSALNLRWDTHRENNQDRIRHGTYAVGESHHMAKLTKDQVIHIYSSDEPGVVLAKRYGVAASKISAVRRGKTWRSVTDSLQGRREADLLQDVRARLQA